MMSANNNQLIKNVHYLLLGKFNSFPSQKEETQRGIEYIVT